MGRKGEAEGEGKDGAEGGRERTHERASACVRACAVVQGNGDVATTLCTGHMSTEKKGED